MKLKELLEDKDKFFTTTDVGHGHVAEVDEKGNGITITTLHGIRPNSFKRWNDHVHKVKNWKCSEVEKHTHTVKKGDRPWGLK